VGTYNQSKQLSHFKMLRKLSVVIISKNEELFISEAINSANFADEVVVVDSGSTDKTCSIAKELGAKVYNQKWLGYGAQKNYAIQKTKNEWVFVLDADERITNELKVEIKETLLSPKFQAYKIARLNNFFGKNIKYCGLYPDYSIRFFKKGSGKFNIVPVHESFQTKKEVGTLVNYMKHNAFNSISEFRKKQLNYANLSCKKPNIFKAFISPIWIFLKIFIFRLGFLEGWRGFLIAVIYSEYTYRKYSERK